MNYNKSKELLNIDLVISQMVGNYQQKEEQEEGKDEEQQKKVDMDYLNNHNNTWMKKIHPKK